MLFGLRPVSLSRGFARSSEHDTDCRPGLSVVPRRTNGVCESLLSSSPTLEGLTHPAKGAGVAKLRSIRLMLLEALGQPVGLVDYVLCSSWHRHLT